MGIPEGYIVGIDETVNGKIYGILLYGFNKNSVDKKWAFSFEKVAENKLKVALRMNKVKVNNVELQPNGELKGTTGSLDRFTPKVNIGYLPIVAIAELRVDDASDRLLGYKIAQANGNVKNIRLDEILGYCRRVTKIAKEKNSDTVPIQNCMYVASTEDKKETIKCYLKNQLIVEHIPIKKPSNAVKTKVNTTENKKQISKLEELFTRDQIEELKIGKQAGVDIRLYGNNKLSASQMKVLRLALQDGVNIRPFADAAFTTCAMRAYAIQSKYGVNISAFVNPEYSVGQIFELATAWLNGVDISKMANPKLSHGEMAKIRIEEENRIWSDEKVSVIDLINQFEDKK